MSQRITSVLLLTLLLAGCGGNPLIDGGGGGGGGGGTDTSDIPAALAVDVKAVAYDGTTLTMEVTGLDSTSGTALVPFARYAGLDVPGYQAFKVQEDALDRMFVALAAESQDGATRAVAVADGGQFQRYYGGGFYERDGAFDAPTIGAGPGAGQVSYAGNYGAITNMGVAGNPDALPVAPGTDPALIPRQPARVEGEIFLNVNFQDNLVNGTIYNRVITDAGFALDDVILLPATITATGTFDGTAEGTAPNEGDVTGTYGGIFGGTNSSSVAGVVHLTAFEGIFENEQEHGVFVLTQCGLAGDDPVCDQVAP